LPARSRARAPGCLGQRPSPAATRTGLVTTTRPLWASVDRIQKTIDEDSVVRLHRTRPNQPIRPVNLRVQGFRSTPSSPPRPPSRQPRRSADRPPAALLVCVGRGPAPPLSPWAESARGAVLCPS